MIPRIVLAALIALAFPASANAALFGVTWNSHPHGNPEVARFGVLWPYGYPIDPNVHAQSIANTGSKEVRLQFLWDQIETAQGVYDWTDPLEFPLTWMSPLIHQYQGDVSGVAGVTGLADLNRFLGSTDDLEALRLK
jgi:hypothetical protein